MGIKKIIIVIVGLFFLMSVPATSSRYPLMLDEPTERAISILNIELIRSSIFLAENESQSPIETKDQTPDSGTAEKKNSGSNSNDVETKPIKPFKPSEEIAAEQAVDFPVDI